MLLTAHVHFYYRFVPLRCIACHACFVLQQAIEQPPVLAHHRLSEMDAEDWPYQVETFHNHMAGWQRSKIKQPASLKSDMRNTLIDEVMSAPYAQTTCPLCGGALRDPKQIEDQETPQP